VKKLLWLLLILPALACSSTLTKPVANLSSEPTATPIPSPPIVTLPTGTARPGACEVTADFSHLRDAPNVAGKVIAWLELGDQLTILPTKPSGDWIQVQFESSTGWINSTYCERK